MSGAYVWVIWNIPLIVLALNGLLPSWSLRGPLNGWSHCGPRLLWSLPFLRSMINLLLGTCQVLLLRAPVPNGSWDSVELSLLLGLMKIGYARRVVVDAPGESLLAIWIKADLPSSVFRGASLSSSIWGEGTISPWDVRAFCLGGKSTTSVWGLKPGLPLPIFLSLVQFWELLTLLLHFHCCMQFVWIMNYVERLIVIVSISVLIPRALFTFYCSWSSFLIKALTKVFLANSLCEHEFWGINSTSRFICN